MSFVIFDTEYTTWLGCQKNGWHGNQKRELVQLAAMKVSDDLKILKKLNLYCRPVINPILSDYFISLSKIDNEFIQKNGVLFPECYQKFKDFVGKDLCLSFAWGRDFSDSSDGAILFENLRLNGMEKDKEIRYRNVAGWFRSVFSKYNLNIETINSGKIAKILGQEEKLKALKLNEHNAFYDVYSLLLGMRCFKTEWKEFYLEKQKSPR